MGTWHHDSHPTTGSVYAPSWLKLPKNWGSVAITTIFGNVSKSQGVSRSSHIDAEHEFVTQLKIDLNAQGITTSSSRAVRRQGDGNTRKVLQETIRASQGIIVIVSPDSRTSRHVQEALQLAKIYRRPVYAVWIKGEDWQECFPRGDSELFTTIDARLGYDFSNSTRSSQL